MDKKIFLIGGIIMALFLVSSLVIYPKIALRQDKISENIASSFLKSETEGIFRNKKVSVPVNELESMFSEDIMGEVDPISNKRIEVDLDKQKIYGYENGVKIYEFLVSTGTWNRTPVGTYKIWAKIKSQKMSGGSKELGTYYYLPNVPSILFFYNDKVPKQIGYSIHGAYWHNNFGKPMSHGCVNMSINESKIIFDWADMDTSIEIYGKMPVISLPFAN